MLDSSPINTTPNIEQVDDVKDYLQLKLINKLKLSKRREVSRHKRILSERKNHLSKDSDVELGETVQHIQNSENQTTLGKIKKLLKLIDLIIALVTCSNIALSIIDNELYVSYTNEYLDSFNETLTQNNLHRITQRTITKQENALRIINIAICICGFILIYIHHYIKLKLLKAYGKLNKYDNMFSSGQYKFLILELCIVIISYPPILNKAISGALLNIYFVYNWNGIFNIIIMLKCYLIFRVYTYFSHWTNDSATSIANKYNVNAGLHFALKAELKTRPYTVLIIITLIALIICAFCLRTFEFGVIEPDSTATSLDQDNPLQNLQNSIWLIIITMTTVGYGDLFPKTHFGRFVIIIASILGMILVSLIVVSLSVLTEFTEEEKKAYGLIKKLNSDANAYQKAANVICDICKLRYLGEKKKRKCFTGYNMLGQSFVILTQLKRNITFFKHEFKLAASFAVPMDEMLKESERKLRENLKELNCKLDKLKQSEGMLDKLNDVQDSLTKNMKDILNRQKKISDYITELNNKRYVKVLSRRMKLKRQQLQENDNDKKNTNVHKENRLTIPTNVNIRKTASNNKSTEYNKLSNIFIAGSPSLIINRKHSDIGFTNHLGCFNQIEVKVNNELTAKCANINNKRNSAVYCIRSAVFSPSKTAKKDPPLPSQPPLFNSKVSSNNINIITTNNTLITSNVSPNTTNNNIITTNECNTITQKSIEYVDVLTSTNCEKLLSHLLKNNKKNLSSSPTKFVNKSGGCVNNKEANLDSDFLMTCNNNNFSQLQDCPQLYLEHIITSDEETNIKRALQNHILFQDLNNEVLSSLLHELFYFTFAKNKVIYEQGDEGNFFYILAEGKVKAETKPDINNQSIANLNTLNQGKCDNSFTVFNNCSMRPQRAMTNPVDKVYSEWECFGELSLISRYKREETLTSITDVAVFCLDGEIFREIIRRLNEIRLRDKFNFLNTISLFQPLGNISKYNVALKLQTKEYKPNEKIIVFGTIGESLYTIKSGLVSCRIGLKEVRQLSPNDYFGQNAILIDMKRSCDVVALTNTICYEISRDDLKEALGNEYRDVILFSFFKACVNNNSYFKEVFIESKLDELFHLFTIHRYTYKERLVDNKFTSNNRLIIILDGSIYKEKEQENGYEFYAKKGDMIGKEQFQGKSSQLCSLLLAYPDCISLEANVDDICKLLDIVIEPIIIPNKCEYKKQDTSISQLDIFGLISKLKKVILFQNLSDKTIENIAKAMKTKKFVLNQIIIKENTIGDTMYLISKGKVRVSSNNKIIRDLEEGNYFGEVALLNPSELRTATITALDDTVIVYEITKKTFDLFINDDNIKNHMKAKLSLQQTSIELKDLYFIKFLGKGKFGNVNLVHNNKNKYAIKAVSRKAVEKQPLLAKYFISERRVMLSLDHPFIITLVKTLKSEHHCFFLMEYVNGKTLDEYISSNTKRRNVYETQFYIGSMLIMIEYLQNKMIAHRDIKLSNVMVNENGYLKLIDFGTAKVLNDYTNTVIGTPHYIAPEILQGKGYSLSCDFWSVGVCMYEIFYGVFPFGQLANEVLDIYKEVLQKELTFPSDDTKYSKVNYFMKDVLKKKVNLRICSVNLLKGKPFFEGFEWDKLIEFKLKPPYVPEIKKKKYAMNEHKKPFMAILQEEVSKMKDKDKQARYHSKWADEF